MRLTGAARGAIVADRTRLHGARRGRRRRRDGGGEEEMMAVVGT
jgi:hypothetical protein